ncbi:MAG: hypothetical protein NTU62_09915 [Spirochaetes bacterium]|nr:hypothetical protein [Spirochaetota bacterium]
MGGCTVCEHASRREIDAELLRGVGVRDVAARWSLTKSSVHRHRAQHIAAEIAARADLAKQADGDSLMAEISEHKGRATAILDGAEKAKDPRTALAAVREIRGVLELTSKIAEIVLHARNLREQAEKQDAFRLHFCIRGYGSTEEAEGRPDRCGTEACPGKDNEPYLPTPPGAGLPLSDSTDPEDYAAAVPHERDGKRDGSGQDGPRGGNGRPARRDGFREWQVADLRARECDEDG